MTYMCENVTRFKSIPQKLACKYKDIFYSYLLKGKNTVFWMTAPNTKQLIIHGNMNL